MPMPRKRVLTTLTLAAAFFLAFLGMRIPALDHDHGPKPRPRAVVEEIAKAPVSAPSDTSQLQLDLAGPSLSLCLVLPAPRHPQPLLAGFETAAPDAGLLPSRASPSQFRTTS